MIVHVRISLLIREYCDIIEYNLLLKLLKLKLNFIGSIPLLLPIYDSMLHPFKFTDTLICNKEIPHHPSSLSSTSLFSLQYYGEQGVGVVCDRTIKKGEHLLIYYGELISTDETNRRIKNTYERKNLNYILTIKEHIINNELVIVTNIDATCHGGVARFVNHSCNPNCRIDMIRSEKSLLGIPCLVSTSLIPVGEQLSFDYSYGQDSDHINNDNNFSIKKLRSYKFCPSKTKCQCQSKYCRGYLPSYT